MDKATFAATTFDGAYAGNDLPTQRLDTSDTPERIGARTTPRPDGCWIYNDTPNDYGYITDHGERISVHRWVCEQTKGPLPEGCHVHHFCENKGCINPKHLIPISPSLHSTTHGYWHSR